MSGGGDPAVVADKALAEFSLNLPPNKSPRRDTAVDPFACASTDSSRSMNVNTFQIVNQINNSAATQSNKESMLAATGVMLGNMAKGFVEGATPLLKDMIASITEKEK